MQSLLYCINLIDQLLEKIQTDTIKQGKLQLKDVQVSKTIENKKKDKKGANQQDKGSKTEVSQEHEYFLKAKLKVGKVVQVEGIEGSDKLYKCQVDLGQEKRQVVAGLKKHFVSSELLGRFVVCVCNLKPAKLAGEVSEAMIMASETQLDQDTVIVKALQPPDGSIAGDSVFVQGLDVEDSSVKQMKSDHWKKVLEQLRVIGGKACHAGTPLITRKGVITLPDIVPDNAIIK